MPEISEVEANNSNNQNMEVRILPNRRARPLFASRGDPEVENLGPDLESDRTTNPPDRVTHVVTTTAIVTPPVQPPPLKRGRPAKRRANSLSQPTESTPTKKKPRRSNSLTNNKRKVAFRDISDIRSSSDDRIPLVTEDEEEPMDTEDQDQDDLMEIPDENEGRHPLIVENSFQLDEYNTHLDMFELLKADYNKPGEKDNKIKKRLYNQAKQLKAQLEEQYDTLLASHTRIRKSLPSSARKQHMEIMSELEEWIEEGQSNFGEASATSLLENSAARVHTHEDKGTLEYHAVRDSFELEDVSMPKGFFNPKVTGKEEIAEHRKNASNLKIPVFDGTAKTPTWESWWKLFYNKVHRFPDYVITDVDKLQYLMEAIKGEPREEVSMDNQGLYTSDTAYSNIIMNLHQLYGKAPHTYDEISRKIAGLHIKGGDKRKHYTGFLTTLDYNVLQHIQVGAAPESAYENAIGRMFNCIPDDHIRYMTDSFANRGIQLTSNKKKFQEYKRFLMEYYSQKKYADKSSETNTKKEKQESNIQPSTSKGHKDSPSSNKNKDKQKIDEKSKQEKKKGEKSTSFRRIFIATCVFHKGMKVKHTPLECRMPNEKKIELSKKLNVCFICQEKGHFGKNCPKKKIIALLATQQDTEEKPESTKKNQSKKFKGSHKKNTKTSEEKSEEKAESDPVKKE